jgi:hypothetical protein
LIAIWVSNEIFRTVTAGIDAPQDNDINLSQF